jgi:hypothetical protein
MGAHTQAKRIVQVLKKAGAKTESRSYGALSHRKWPRPSRVCGEEEEEVG